MPMATKMRRDPAQPDKLLILSVDVGPGPEAPADRALLYWLASVATLTAQAPWCLYVTGISACAGRRSVEIRCVVPVDWEPAELEAEIRRAAEEAPAGAWRTAMRVLLAVAEPEATNQNAIDEMAQ